MAYPADTKITIQKSALVFDVLSDLAVLSDAANCALVAANDQLLPPLPIPPAFNVNRIACVQFPIFVCLPSNSPFRTSPDDGWNVESFDVIVRAADTPPNYPPGFIVKESKVFRSIYSIVYNAALVIFYERYRPQIEAIFTKDEELWPPTLRFARHIRNAASHHEGSLNIRDRSPPLGPITWHHISYSSADNGKRILWAEDGMGGGDIICLLLDMACEFEKLGFSRANG